MPPANREEVTFGALAAAIIAVVTLLHGAVVMIPTFTYSMGWTSQPDPAWYRLIWWALGHQSQQVNVCAMVAVWYLLSRITVGARPINEAVCRTAFVLYILFINLASAHHLLVDPGVGAAWKIWNTSYAMYLAVLASMIHGFTVPAGIELAMREKGYTNGIFGWVSALPWKNPAFSGTALSSANPMPDHHQHPDVDCEVLADAMGPSSVAPGSHPPAPPVRAAWLLAAGDRWSTRLDSLLERWLPRELNPLAQLGQAANAMLVLATLSGVLMLIWYSASLQLAWHSLADLGPRSLGGIVRSVHRYSSDLLMLLVLAHAWQTFFARKFADARWLAWASGIALLGLIWFIGWTGYWLVWDVRAQLLALDTMKAVDVLPVFGEPMLRLFTSDRTVPSLLFFVVFFLHMVMPLAIAGGLCVHLARLSRSQLLPDWRLSAWLVGAVVVAALVLPAANAGIAQMAVKPGRLTMDWCFLWPLTITARLSGGGLWMAAGGAAIGLVTVPWWLARRRPRPTFQAAVNISRCFSCTLCSHDCPFGAITMVPRTDGKPFPSQAQIDPNRCIGCGVCAGACDTQGIGLAWFDAQQVTRELEAFVLAEIARGTPPALALVCAQSDGGWELFAARAWQARLPGYTVRPVPRVGWIEPKLVERVISKGATAVLTVGCGSSEAFCREGNQWLPARLSGAREPAFRPNRADPRKVAHVDFNPLRPQRLTEAVERLRTQKPPMAASRQTWPRRWIAGLPLTALVLLGLLFASDAPFRNPASAEAEFVFTFRAYGEWVSGAAAALPDPAHDTRPIHMRTAQPAKRTRSPVIVRLDVEGRAEEHVYQPKGFKSDGFSVGELRVPLTPGRHRVTVSVTTLMDPKAARQEWTAEIDARPGRLTVLTLEANRGFQLEP